MDCSLLKQHKYIHVHVYGPRATDETAPISRFHCTSHNRNSIRPHTTCTTCTTCTRQQKISCTNLSFQCFWILPKPERVQHGVNMSPFLTLCNYNKSTHTFVFESICLQLCNASKFSFSQENSFCFAAYMMYLLHLQRTNHFIEFFTKFSQNKWIARRDFS